MKGVVENLPKLVLVKLVPMKMGNGEKKFLQNNTIVTKNNNEFYFPNQSLTLKIITIHRKGAKIAKH